MTALRLRQADSNDADAIARLVNLAFLAERPFVDGDRTNAAGIRDLLSKGHFLLGFENDALLACVYVETHRERAYIGLLSVDPAHQHGGFGGQLMEAAEERCRAAGCRFVDVRFINHRTELLRFYAKQGYVENGTVAFPETSRMKMPFHFIQMSKELK